MSQVIISWGSLHTLVDIIALLYTSNVFESSLNNLRLFFNIPSNSNRIIQSFILKEKQILVWAYCFLACAGLVENLLQVAVMKKWVKDGKKKQLSAWSIININNFKGKVKINLYLLSISWVFDQHNFSYSTLKFFVFGRFFVNFLPGKRK